MGKINRQHHEDAKLLKKVFKTIAEQCLECSGESVQERKFCSCECKLWPYRFGCRPARVNPELLDKKNFAEGAKFGSNKEVAKFEKVAKVAVFI